MSKNDSPQLDTVIGVDNASPVRLYQFHAMVQYAVVVAATSEEDARDAISSWENAWADNSDFVGVSDVQLTDVRDLGEQTKQWAEDEAHEISIRAHSLLDAKEST